ncbi:MAG TPA: sugar ABC transporter permease, partial [Pseudonocardiaceae bacterium]
VPQELLESADVDGAGRWQRFRAVTLPAIWPAATFLTIMLVIGGFNVFTSVLLMTNGGPADQTQVLLTYMYEVAFKNLDFGYGSAIAVLLTILVFVLSVVQMRVFRGQAKAAS